MIKRGKVVYIACIVSFFLAIVLIVFMKRNDLLNYLIQSKVRGIEKEKNISILYENLRLKGIRAITLDRLSIVPHGWGTLVKATHLEVGLSFLELLKLNGGCRTAERRAFEFLFQSASRTG